MKTITIDENAHKIIVRAQDELIKLGVERNNMSEAIRYLDRGRKI